MWWVFCRGLLHLFNLLCFRIHLFSLQKLKICLCLKGAASKGCIIFIGHRIFPSIPLCLNSTIHQKAKPEKENPQFSLQIIDGCYTIKGPIFSKPESKAGVQNPSDPIRLSATSVSLDQILQSYLKGLGGRKGEFTYIKLVTSHKVWPSILFLQNENFLSTIFCFLAYYIKCGQGQGEECTLFKVNQKHLKSTAHFNTSWSLSNWSPRLH